MVSYGRQRILGRVIVLLLLLLALAAGSVVWFDYLGVIDAKPYLAPIYRLFSLTPRAQKNLPPDAVLSLDGERLTVRQEALDLRDLELDQREEGIVRREAELTQKAQDLEERQKSLDEREKSFNVRLEQFENRRVNIEQNARYLVGMLPEKAAAIIDLMDDQDAIDVFRMTEEIAASEGTLSMVAYWLSLLPAKHSAELQRKMSGKPRSLN